MIISLSMTEHEALYFCIAEDKKRMETFGGPKLHGSAVVPVIYIVPCGNGKSTIHFIHNLYTILCSYMLVIKVLLVARVHVTVYLHIWVLVLHNS